MSAGRNKNNKGRRRKAQQNAAATRKRIRREVLRRNGRHDLNETQSQCLEQAKLRMASRLIERSRAALETVKAEVTDAKE
jgi:hypothetical protein